MKEIVRMSGGLANRMFQYSYYLYLHKHGFDAFVDYYKAMEWKHEDIEWGKIFPHAYIRQAPALWIHFMFGGYNLIDKVIRHFLPFLSKVYMHNRLIDFIPASELEEMRYIIGVHQNASIVEEVESEVIKMFEFSPFQDKRNLILAENMKKENSVAIHVRKGRDYIQQEKIKGTCPVQYYKDAIKLIKDKVDNPHFYLFTDNKEWVKENLTDFEYTLVDFNPTAGFGNHFDMQLMAACKHNVIANSTYSWWGAYLNRNPDKIVIGPKHWFNPSFKEYKEVSNKTLCKNWIQL